MSETIKWYFGCYECKIYVGPVDISAVEGATEKHRINNTGRHTMVNYEGDNHFLGRNMQLVSLNEFIKTRKIG